ncbi:MAG: hypothetical protein KGH57_02440 [Candidatus Micrarchaeota archaeon]|nr:hypothetical protein [Candidatus Micrarchaeota archaeon]
MAKETHGKEPESIKSILAKRKRAWDDLAAGKITIKEFRGRCPPVVAATRHSESRGNEVLTEEGWKPFTPSLGINLKRLR